MRIVASLAGRENDGCRRGAFAISTATTPRSPVNGLRSRFGPGLLFAAAAVGTSHLVQSTRAGAGYGLTLAALIGVVCLLKYPLFRFAADYAAATGESLVAGYRRQGVTLVWVMLLVSAIEAVAAVAGVTLVTAGITRWMFSLETSDLSTALVILALTTLLVGVGRYRLLEVSAGVLVVLFSLLTLITTLAALPILINSPGPVFGDFAASTANLTFATAVSGWMPIGNTAAIMLAAWILARQQQAPRAISAARFDFNVGYLASSLLALCFLIMGAAVLFGRVASPAGGAQFAETFVDMFTAVVGEWSRWLVAVAAFAVMYSTLLAILDGFPRLLLNFLQALRADATAAAQSQAGFLILLVIVAGSAAVFLSFFLSSFTAFIDLVTITGFIAAPLVAWVNYLVIRGDNVPLEARPGRVLILWNTVAVVTLLVASASFLYLRFLA